MTHAAWLMPKNLCEERYFSTYKSRPLKEKMYKRNDLKTLELSQLADFTKISMTSVESGYHVINKL